MHQCTECKYCENRNEFFEVYRRCRAHPKPIGGFKACVQVRDKEDYCVDYEPRFLKRVYRTLAGDWSR